MSSTEDASETLDSSLIKSEAAIACQFCQVGKLSCGKRFFAPEDKPCAVNIPSRLPPSPLHQLLLRRKLLPLQLRESVIPNSEFGGAKISTRLGAGEPIYTHISLLFVKRRGTGAIDIRVTVLIPTDVHAQDIVKDVRDIVCNARDTVLHRTLSSPSVGRHRLLPQARLPLSPPAPTM
ncbi:hypothetical protein GGX14DRAFT_573596 [Mycena pura]|uniref:Uncharacterized protein n=1 Tax=Mycena pura TaxID=153505 RepID=A0AAD6Y9W1_9AGAR|nr:hypothetical protein GGX14DRAFT_573596 [Mycena pura]